MQTALPLRACPHCATPKQIDRPCPRCGFTGLAENVLTFMLVPELSLPEEARLHATQFAEAMLRMQQRPPGLIN